KKQQQQQAARQRGRTHAVGQQQGLLDADSLDSLEALLEATDMQAVEGSRLAVLAHGDVWSRMRAGFKMQFNPHHSRIAAQRSWFVTRQSYLDRLTARASRYLHYTVSEAEKRGLPTELALLPVIESSYDPAATSNAAAAGMWQFIPSTGRIYGLKQTDSYDGRRDVIESTRAAYDFLGSLYNQFGSWELALAAYNAGPGRVQQAIRRNEAAGLPTDYWSLRLPTETMHYVPRFLAVAQIVKNPSQYDVNFPPIANRPHFREVSLNGQVRLADAAQILGITEQDLYVLNPGFRQGVTSFDGPQRLLIPTSLSPNLDLQVQRLARGGSSSGALMAGGLTGGVTVVSRSSGYSNAEAAALMGRPSAPLTVKSTTTAQGVSTQVTTRSNSPSAPEVTTRVQLPTNSSALAALASAASVPTSGVPTRLAMPVFSGQSSRPIAGEPPLSAAERERVVAAVVTPSSTGRVSTPPVVAEPALSDAERQRLMQALTATSTVAPQVVLEPALNETEKAQLVQEIQSIAPAGTTVVDPLDGKIPLVALQTQQSVLDSQGAERQVSYEQPAFTQQTSAATAVATPTRVAKPATPPRPKGERTIYNVQAGDSLTAVANRFGVSVQDVAEWNQMSATANLMTGASLYL
ncbi:MAG: transglycosylase SLT domain-containing protein, partial [Pseudomonadota bacterium]|nr:transglycosylase SLT domain-containing protein [Pseudomonadota bacterium]